MKSILLKTLILGIILLGIGIQSAEGDNNIPFSVDNKNITIWNGENYTPFFIKGTNLGIAKPGTYPGEMAASREDYQEWFTEIKEAGFNCIRLYTLHFPHFYEELRTYNLSHPQHPLFYFQGVWLEEEANGYEDDLYFLTDLFQNEIKENINCAHGQCVIAERAGKAYGTYTADTSPWLIGYIIGREVYGKEVYTTNEDHPLDNNFDGEIFNISNASATECWFTKQLEFTVNYEKTTYNTQRPVAISSWPTLDPIPHPEEKYRQEDTAQVDLSKVQNINAPAGFFISYHIYPFYPDFISNQDNYKNYFDNNGPNSYLGYLLDLKSHYTNCPLLVAEYGIPSSIGTAHYNTSGMNHGGYDENDQGEMNIRLLKAIESANLAGGIQFAWIDEWFKNTWITAPLDFGNRVLWHNMLSPEQNFGLKKFLNKKQWEDWKNFSASDDITKISAKADYDFFQVKLHLKEPMNLLGDCWIGFDTYDSTLGESILPDGKTIPTRAEFALFFNQYSAKLFVTQSYDLYEPWRDTANQKLQSTATDGKPWNIMRWRTNNISDYIQFLGELRLNRHFQPVSSADAVRIYNDSIVIRIPWNLLHFVDPSDKTVIHDDKNTSDTETRTSDGISIHTSYNGNLYSTDTRFLWSDWNSISANDVSEEYKASYWKMYERLNEFNSPSVALPDTFELNNSDSALTVTSTEGLIQNDFDLDGVALMAVLIEGPQYGIVELNADGSFTYFPRKGFKGKDYFEYALFDGESLSNTTKVTINIKKKSNFSLSDIVDPIFTIYPNPIQNAENITIDSKVYLETVWIFDHNGKMISEQQLNAAQQTTISIVSLKPGIYSIVSQISGKFFSQKLIVK